MLIREKYLDTALQGALLWADGRNALTANLATGGNEITGLPATPSATGASSKEYVDGLFSGVPTTGSENIELTAAATEISPSTGKPTINLYGSPSALPGDVTFLHRFNTGLDANFGGDTTHTVEGGSPSVSGGRLDLRAASPTSILTDTAISFDRLANAPGGNLHTIRVLWTPNYNSPVTGLPPPDAINIVQLTGTSTGTTNANEIGIRHVRTSQDYVQCYWRNSTDSTGVSEGFVFFQLDVVAGQTYEIEVNINASGNEMNIFVDGVLGTTDTFLGGAQSFGSGAKIILGGLNSTANNSSPNGSNHQIDGLCIFNAVQHTTAGGNYTPVGLPGTGVTVENISSIDGSLYADGDELTVITLEPTRYTFVDSATPSPDELSLNGNFVPASGEGFLKVRKVGTYWVEVQRSPSVVAFPTSDDKAQTPAATSGNESATGVTITNTPGSDGYVRVLINGIGKELGDGVKTADCYFSPDGGTTARAIADIQAGDEFIWNGIIAGFELDSGDSVSFDYSV